MTVGHALKCGDPVSGPSSENSSYCTPSNVNGHLCIFLNSLRKKMSMLPFSRSLPGILHSCKKARVSPGISVPTLFSAVHTTAGDNIAHFLPLNNRYQLCLVKTKNNNFTLSLLLQTSLRIPLTCWKPLGLLPTSTQPLANTHFIVYRILPGSCLVCVNLSNYKAP